MKATAAPRVIWAPHPGSQTDFLRCPYREVLYHGTRGPGKSDALLMDFAQHVGRGYGSAWTGILFRRTMPELRDLIAKSQKWFNQIFPDASFNKNEHTWVWPGGEKLILTYMHDPEDYWGYHGHEYPWIGWSELTTWPSLDCYERMRSCCRSSHPDVPRKIRAETNPWGPGHGAVKAYFIDPCPVPGRPFRFEVPLDDGSTVALTRAHLFGHLSENKTLGGAEGKTYLAEISSVEDPALRKAWLEGSWDIVAGGMFTDSWRKAVHVIAPFKIPAAWRKDRSFDWGTAKPFSVGWWAESNGEEVELADGSRRSFPRGTLFRVAEWYGCQKGKPNKGLGLVSSEVARTMREMETQLGKSLGLVNVLPGPADSAIYDAGHDGRSIGDVMAQNGVRWLPAQKGPGSRRNGWQLLRERLAASTKHPMESPGLFVFDSCADFIRTIPSLQRSERDPEDVDTDSEDHVGDETRYRLLQVRTSSSSSSLYD